MSLKTVSVLERLGQDIRVPVIFLKVMREAWRDRLVEPLGLLIRLEEVSGRKLRPSSPAQHIRRQGP